MIRIGLISDTHLYSTSKLLPEIVFSTFKNCSQILHAGDILCEEVLISLEKIAPVTAVAGNNDPQLLADKLGFQKEMQVENYNLCLLHGHDGYGSALQNVVRGSKKSSASIFVFGHSHQPIFFEENGKYFINPGSAIQRRFQPKCSVAVLEISEMVKVDFVYF